MLHGFALVRWALNVILLVALLLLFINRTLPFPTSIMAATLSSVG